MWAQFTAILQDLVLIECLENTDSLFILSLLAIM